MQEKLKTFIGATTEVTQRRVVFCLQSRLFILFGDWNWEMQSDAVYCSDVMSFPEEFEGTKGIIHPDDMSKAKAGMEILDDFDNFKMDFRIITSYGEVKSISGQKITLEPQTVDGPELLPGREQWDEALQFLATRSELDFLQLQKQLTDLTEQINGVGGWLINKDATEVWYSDNVFRIHGLPPQSLNVHANTFYRFIHPDDTVTTLDTLEKAYAEELPVHLEYRIVSAGGDDRTVKLITTWFFNSKGQRIFAGILKNITDERSVADELLAAQSSVLLHRQVLKLSELQCSTGYFYINLSTRKGVYSENCFRIYGLKATAVPSYNSFLNQVHPDDKERIRQLTEKMYSEHVLPESEFQIIRPDGKIRHLRQSGKMFIRQGVEFTLIGIVQDITLVKGLELKLYEQQEAMKLQLVISEMTESISGTSSVCWFADGTMQWSDGFYRMLGYKPGGVEPLPRILYKNIHPTDLIAFKTAESLASINKQKEPVIVRIVSKAGVVPVRFTFHQTEFNQNAVIGFVQDVRQNLTLERKLAENKSFTDLVVAAVDDVLILTNTDHVILVWNENAVKKTGISKEAALHHHLFDILPGLNNETFLGQLHQASRGMDIHTTVPVTNYYFKKSHQYHLWPLEVDEENRSNVLHVVQDVSKELELQKQLNERLNFIENMVEASVERIVVLDRNMNYVYWNRKAEEYYGISKERVIGRNILEIFPSFRNHPNYVEFRKVLKGESIHFPAFLDEETTEYAETYLTPVKDGAGDVLAVLWTVHSLGREYELQKQKLQVEEATKLQSDFLQRAIETMPCMISVANLATGEFEYLNKEIFQMHGFDTAVMSAMSPEERMETIHPDDRTTIADYFGNLLLASDSDVITAEYRTFNNEGRLQWVLIKGRIFQRDGQNKPTHVINIIELIEEKKSAGAI